VGSQVVSYQLDSSTTVQFEIDPADGFRPASPGQVSGKIREAVGPAIEAAKAVLDRAKEIRPDEIEITFGIKVSGDTHWLVAKAAAEASFEITLTWSPRDRHEKTESKAGEPDPPADDGAEPAREAEPSGE
jgi:hypothetical protein